MKKFTAFIVSQSHLVLGFWIGALFLALILALINGFQATVLVGLLGPAVTGLAVWAAVTQAARSRERAEIDTAKSAGIAAQEALRLVGNRLRPRFNPMLQEIEGKTMRGARSAETVEALREIKISDLPLSFVQSFLTMRAGLHALTEALDDTPWPKPGSEFSKEEIEHLTKFKATLEWANDAHLQYRSLLMEKYRYKIEDVVWTPPKPGTIEYQIQITPLLAR